MVVATPHLLIIIILISSVVTALTPSPYVFPQSSFIFLLPLSQVMMILIMFIFEYILLFYYI